MKLRFYARKHTNVREAGVARQQGQASRYYGRTFVPGKTSFDEQYPVDKEPFEVEAGTEDGDKCLKHCRKGDLLAADKGTAAAANVEFVETEFKNGDHAVKAKAPSKPGAGGKGDS